jgi:hypothetical protein
MGDIKGEISMAPMITAVELVSSPMEARRAEQIINHTLVPLIPIPTVILFAVLE